MRTTSKAEITIAEGLPVIHRVVRKISYIEGRAYGEVNIHGNIRVVKQSCTNNKLHWNKDTWQLSDFYKGEV